mmetsp:Transcript_25042/g.64656  ORF Transcript_25042/g.64656 Transcript_25042/m.64656 type:complete len:204 (-) Transcript_25042:1680-2291(-)
MARSSAITWKRMASKTRALSPATAMTRPLRGSSSVHVVSRRRSRWWACTAGRRGVGSGHRSLTSFSSPARRRREFSHTVKSNSDLPRTVCRPMGPVHSRQPNSSSACPSRTIRFPSTRIAGGRLLRSFSAAACLSSRLAVPSLRRSSPKAHLSTRWDVPSKSSVRSRPHSHIRSSSRLGMCSARKTGSSSTMVDGAGAVRCVN